MAIDTSIYGLSGRGVKSVADYDREYEQLLGARQDRQMGALQLMLGQQKADEYTRGVERANQLRALSGTWKADTTDEQRVASLRNAGFAQEADALEKGILERMKTRATVDKDTAEAASKRNADKIKAYEFHVQRLGQVADPQMAEAWLTEGVKSGVMSMQEAQQGLKILQSRPDMFPEWKARTLQGGMSALQQMQEARAAAQAADTRANQTLVPGPDGTYIPNQPLIDAKKAIAKAGASSVSVNTGQKGLDNERNLRNDFRSEAVVKAYEEMAQAHKQIKAGLSQANPVGDMAAATKIMKLLDPGSVVRESELAMAMAASGRLDRLQNFAQMFISGEKLTPQQRREFLALADELLDATGNAYNVKRQEYLDLGGRYQLDTSVIGGAYGGKPKKPAAKPAGAAPAPGAAPRVVDFNSLPGG